MSKPNFFLVEVEDENFFIKDRGEDDVYDVEEGIEDAESFTEEECKEIIEINEGRFKMIAVTDVIAN